ncbi:MAG: GyrI-like domain-containing protein, partial [Dehalococcoidia bacterium]
CELWERFDGHIKDIKHQVEGKSYEIHIQEETTPPMHFCLVGVEVRKIEDLPVELFAKVVPACEYAVFTHHFRDGGFRYAFKAVYDWLENSEYTSTYHLDVQCYDSRFRSPEDPESILEIYVPVTPKHREAQS